MITLGLTGSMAMGKSTAAKLFADQGIAVFDSDAEVHRQYAEGGEAVTAVAGLFPEAVVGGRVDRTILSGLVLGNRQALQRLQSAVHPIVRKHQQAFLARCRAAGHEIAVLDMPLLFETGRQHEVDRIVVVSAPPDIQRRRAMGRPGMTEEKFAQIQALQMPDAEKRGRADFIIDTSRELEYTSQQIANIIAMLLPGWSGR